MLLFVLWYCHKRGKEVRLEKEEAEAREAVHAEARDAEAAMDAADAAAADQVPIGPIIEVPPSLVVAEEPQKLLEAPPRDSARAVLSKEEERELAVSK